MNNSYLNITYPKTETGNYPELLTHYLIRKCVGNYNNGIPRPRLLEIGYGRGVYLSEFYKYGFSLYGIDKEIEQNVLNCELQKCNLEKEKIPYPDNHFRLVFTKSVIEHVNNTEKFLSESYRVLYPKGTIIVLTPAWEYNYRDFYNDPTHIKPFHRKGLQDALKMAGFKKVNAQYFYQLPFVWKHSYLKFIPKLISLLPDNLKWKNKEETIHRKLIRFSKEVMLLGIGNK